MSTATKSIVSVGQLCGWLQRSMSEIRKAAEKAGVNPVMRINGIDYFSEDDVSRIRRALPRPRKALTK